MLNDGLPAAEKLKLIKLSHKVASHKIIKIYNIANFMLRLTFNHRETKSIDFKRSSAKASVLHC
ncbi:MAG: hypothetical protein EAY75_14625 [Bacteroidetes bacterium]|nr:MAG: hypothetical protein EAY75_14625 [Bacteroidota bacterium]